MDAQSLSIPIEQTEKKTGSQVVSTLQSTLLVFLLFFPVTFMMMFFHEAGHALFHLIQGVPIKFLYAHPFSFLGFVRPTVDYGNLWQHASGTVTELLVFSLIFILLWKRRSFYTLPFLMVFPWIAIYDGLGGIFDVLGHTGDYHNIMVIMGWPAAVFYIMSLVLIVVGIFFFISLIPLMGLAPKDGKTLFVLPAGMLLYAAVGLPVAYFLVPGSPIDLGYHLAHEIIMSAYYRPIMMGSTGILLALIYTTLYRRYYKSLPVRLQTEKVDLSWRVFWYPGLLFTISIVLGLIVIL
jgi:hypothetical protein